MVHSVIQDARKYTAFPEITQSRVASPAEDALNRAIQAQLGALQSHLDTIQTQVGVVRAHQDGLLDLYKQWNDVQPISKLPPEVLTEIFRIFVTIHHGYHPCHWIAFSQVCHEWRALALNSPTLWTSINLYAGSAYLTDILPRTKKAPLTIHIPFSCALHNPLPTDVTPILTTLLDREMSRVQELTLIGIPSPTMLQSAPELRKLVLELHTFDRDLSMFSDIFHNNAAPVLEHLHLTGFAWMERPICLSHLKTFSFHASDDIPVEVIVSTLRNFPLLETLKLKGYMSYQGGQLPPNDSQSIVVLPFVRTIEI